MPILRSIPCSYFIKIQQVSIGGTPDILGTIHGRIIALELKADSKSKATPLQLKNLTDIANAGGYAKVVHPDNWEDTLLELLNIKAPSMGQ